MRVFISYARDDEAVARAALALAEQLRVDGVHADIDEWALAPGDRVPEFMERSIYEADVVVFACCPAFKVKAEKALGGVGVEASHARARDYFSNLSAAFIPVILAGTFEEAVPRFLRSRMAIDLTPRGRSPLGYQKLWRAIQGLAPIQPPVAVNGPAGLPGVADVLGEFEAALASPDSVAAVRACINRHPFVLNSLRGFKRYFPTFDFGGEIDPDLVFAGWGNYTVWSLVKLESPSVDVFAPGGLLSATLEEAARHVQHWNVWNPQDVDRNTTDDFSTVSKGLVVEAFILIGRRASLGMDGKRRLAQLNTLAGPRLKVVTYDTLLEFISEQTPHSLYHYQSEWLAQALSDPRPAVLG